MSSEISELKPIGVIRSPFKEKFGVPRQPGLVSEAKCVLELLPPYAVPEAVSGLEAYSHVWVLFQFHQAVGEEWQPMVRPPRLGGNRKVGVFASRSPFRPNSIGLSVLKLDQLAVDNGRVELHLSGGDMVDGTPVVDVKPYVAYADSIPEAVSGYAMEPPEKRLQVYFSKQAESQLASRGDGEELIGVIKGVLALDPRPAYRGNSGGERIYGMRLYDFDLRWRVEDDHVVVEGLEPPER
jgi:tRNA-Thr(GGU) m(6)t(6)A37 methyltransferase TsaA